MNVISHAKVRLWRFMKAFGGRPTTVFERDFMIFSHYKRELTDEEMVVQQD